MMDPLLAGSAAQLPPGFSFSQTSLQDFLDCRRRFQLRYILGFSWPAVESEPVLEHELYVLQGITLHHLVHQWLLGVPQELLEPSTRDTELQQWWLDFQNFAESEEIDRCADFWPEYSLSTSLGGFRLVAKYDLVTRKSNGEFSIYDWKTSRHTPDRKIIAERMQTRLYPYLLAKAGAEMNEGGIIDPENITTAYWYTSFPDQAIGFRYGQEKFIEDHSFIEDLIAKIVNLPVDQFLLTEDLKRCGFCVFRSFCERGDLADTLKNRLEQSDAPDHLDSQIDFESITEIEL